jgi:hypothetical protein
MGTASKLSLAGLVAWASACGPSLATVHEGTVRFEHCYRVDLEPRVSPAYRLACWRSWISAYTVGQPRDRIEYAEHRRQSLESGDATPPELSLDSNPAPGARQLSLVLPAPTNVHAPPPPVAKPIQELDAEASSDAGSPSELQAKTDDSSLPPSSTCTKRCQSSWRTCDESCERSSTAPCTKCKSTYTKCMRGCFE